MSPDPTDAEVIEASTADPPRFAVIFDRHVAGIHRFLARRTGPDGADALTGECFRIAFERRGTYRLDRPDARPWLYGIANNVLREHRRGERRRWAGQARMHAAAGVDAAGPPADAAHDGLADRLDAEAAWPRLRAALEAMRPEERDAILLVAWEDLTYREVALALDVPVGTVRSRLHRARQHLREQLAPLGQEGDDTHTTRSGRFRP